MTILKQSSRVYWQIVLTMTGIAILYLIKSIYDHRPIFDLLKIYVLFLVFFSVVLWVLERGNYIELSNKDLIIYQEYFKANYDILKIKKIYYHNHFFLGPTLFMEYSKEKEGDNRGLEKKIMVLSNYEKTDIKNLLKQLKEKSIKLDEYCENLIQN